MFTTEIHVNSFLLNYVDGLLKDIPDERMAELPAAGVNHPAWILGHLIYTGDAVVSMLGGAKELPEHWAKLFGGGSELTSNRTDYPGKTELLDLLKSRFLAARQLLAVAPESILEAPNPRLHMRERLPTVADMVSFVLTGHFGIHLGQLSTWRRLIGLKRLF